MESKLAIPLIFLALVYLSEKTTAASVKASSSFIKSSCASVNYPALCEESLSPFAKIIQNSTAQLAHIALVVSLKQTQSTQDYLDKLKRVKGLNPRERSAVGDCLEVVNDSLDRVSKSIKELKNCEGLKGHQFLWRMSNVQTWVSSALTDENTCMYGFGGRSMEGRIKTSVQAQIASVAHVTSNALALVNNFAQTH